MINELYHFGILGMHWGVRRFQNADGSLTSAGKERYNQSFLTSKAISLVNRLLGKSSQSSTVYQTPYETRMATKVAKESLRKITTSEATKVSKSSLRRINDTPSYRVTKVPISSLKKVAAKSSTETNPYALAIVDNVFNKDYSFTNDYQIKRAKSKINSLRDAKIRTSGYESSGIKNILSADESIRKYLTERMTTVSNYKGSYWYNLAASLVQERFNDGYYKKGLNVNRNAEIQNAFEFFEGLSDRAVSNYESALYHHGILGMHWGIRRYQNSDGTLTEAGKERYDDYPIDEEDEKEKRSTKKVSKIAFLIGAIAGLTLYDLHKKQRSEQGFEFADSFKDTFASDLHSNSTALALIT